MWWTILPKSSRAKAFFVGIKRPAITRHANVNVLLFLIMTALLLLLSRLVRVFFSLSKMAPQRSHLVHGDVPHQIDYRKLPGFRHQDHHAANLVTVLQDINLVIFVKALFHALYDFAPARRGEL